MAALDPSLFLLFLFAITCIIYGSHRSYAFFTVTLVAHKEAAEAVSSLKWKNVAAFIIVGSVVLLSLFFFFSFVYYLLLVLVTIVSFVSLFFVLSPAVDALFHRFKWEAKEISVPRLPPIPLNVIALSVVCIAINLIWITTGFWFVVNCIAWCIGVTQLSVIKLPHLKISVILLSAFLVYDVFWVFISPYIFGTSVMVEVAVHLPTNSLPMALTMPRFFGDGYSLLGLGDIVLPGLFMSFVFAFDRNLAELAFANPVIKPPPKLSYFTLVLLGYTVGFAVTLLSFMLMERGQPALLYLVPFTVGTITIYAHFKGHLSLMWNGISAPAPDSGERDLAIITHNANINAPVGSPSAALLHHSGEDEEEDYDTENSYYNKESGLVRKNKNSTSSNNYNNGNHTTDSNEVGGIADAIKAAVSEENGENVQT